MKMTDLLEKDRENILTSITQAGTAAKAVTILENETDNGWFSISNFPKCLIK